MGQLIILSIICLLTFWFIYRDELNPKIAILILIGINLFILFSRKGQSNETISDVVQASINDTDPMSTINDYFKRGNISGKGK